MSNPLLQFRGPGGGFGQGSYDRAIAAGFSPAAIAAYLPSSGLSVGERAQASLSNALSQLQSQASQASSYSSELESYKSRLSDYERQVGELRSSVDTYRSQFDAARLNYENTLKERETTLKQKESDLLKAQTDAAAAQADAERYRDLSINSQLRDLRSGAAAPSGPQGGETPSLSSGIKRPQAGDDRTLVDVRSRIDATDSVLSRKKPVVEVINGPQGPARPSSAGSGSSGGSSGGAAGYYARRFG